MLLSLARGLVLTAAASDLGVSERTARTHVQRAMQKLGAATRIEAVARHQRAHKDCRRRTGTV